jgi:hypothetical protein
MDDNQIETVLMPKCYHGGKIGQIQGWLLAARER